MEIRKNLIHEQSKGFDCKDPSRTVQAFKNECDVNNIIENYTHTGLLPNCQTGEPVFDDFTKIPQCYGDMVNMLEESRERFMMLPAKVRRRFNDDPRELIKFIEDDKNYDEAKKLGFIKVEEVSE